MFRNTIWRWFHPISILILSVATVYAGLELRRWAWDVAEPIRFQWDIQNAYRWGERANAVGYFQLYDHLMENASPSRGVGLDYAPGRLLIATVWVSWLQAHDPPVTRWENRYEHTWPLLYLNASAQLVACTGLFLLAWVWLRRGGAGAARAGWLALLAAGLMWFNPALICNGHAWPQWDSWLLPFAVWALLLASWDRWLMAGMMIGVGCMFKGQLLIASPLLLLWPLFQRKGFGALAVIVGFFAGAALATSSWLLRSPDALTLTLAAGMAATAALGALRWRWRTIATVWTTAVTAAAWIGAAALGGSLAWLHAGFGKATGNRQGMAAGMVANLADLLQREYRWRLHDSLGWPGLEDVTIRTALITAYGAALLACAWRTAQLARRRETSVLLPMTAVWVAMFTLMPQMHERYLVWGAALSAVWVCVGFGPFLLHLALTVFAWVPMLNVMFRQDRTGTFLPAWRNALSETYPGSAWGLLVLCGVLLYLCMQSRQRQPVPLTDRRQIDDPQGAASSFKFKLLKKDAPPPRGRRVTPGGRIAPSHP